jgi:hypothetical protein
VDRSKVASPFLTFSLCFSPGLFVLSEREHVLCLSTELDDIRGLRRTSLELDRS